jgi:hypothetical protein
MRLLSNYTASRIARFTPPSTPPPHTIRRVHFLHHVLPCGANRHARRGRPKSASTPWRWRGGKRQPRLPARGEEPVASGLALAPASSTALSNRDVEPLAAMGERVPDGLGALERLR